MWPIPSLKNEYVTISFSPNNFICSWIQKHNNTLLLKSYKNFTFDHFELEKLIIFNPTIIKESIQNFLKKYTLENVFLLLSLDGGLLEKYVTLPTSMPQKSDFAIGHTSHVLWDYHYLYSNDCDQFVFYVYAIQKLLLLQYQLLALSGGFNIITIMPRSIALLSLYKYMYGSAFREAQFAHDMMRVNNRIELLMSEDILKRLIIIPPSIAIDAYNNIASACGLYIAEREKV